ncbi:uncharacterized protein LOC131234713 [Magnolia sinica]|uniref:uncharacterized protein LOC131234713 n=1 Tax=Magnolia sinica TaxID=86752 RepID=UPI00265B3333|nr:uncharacterized protein LOC131234713 [Magnolia sinica]
MMEKSLISDDFTFPTLADNSSPSLFQFPGFSDSSLWYFPSTTKEEEQETHERERSATVEDGEKTDNLQRDIEFPNVGHLMSVISDDVDVTSIDGDEKMDMLWEDFNDELSRQASLGRQEAKKGNGWEADSSKITGLGHVKTLKVSKSTSLLPHGRPSLLVILKVLKKLFLLHNSRCPNRT